MKQMKTSMAGVMMAVGLGVTSMAQTNAPQAATPAPAKKSWTDNVTLKADARFRYQSTDEEGKDTRERWRFRGRVSLDGKVNDQVKAGLRLVTNTGDPLSDNQTMTNAFDDKDARFDRVFFTWTPVSDLGLTFGKMAQPWIAVSDLVFSADVNPEGVSASYAAGMDAAELLLHGGGFVVEERSAEDETKLYTGQAALKFKTGDKTHILVGGSIYLYEGVEGKGLLFDPAKGYGNSTTAVGEGEEEMLLYAVGYSLLEGFVEAKLNVGAPLRIGAQYVVNTDADDDDTGYLGEFAVTLPRGFEVGYQYRYLEKDAVLGVFAESTDVGNGTDVEGHIPYVKYAVNKNFDVKVQYSMGEKGLDNGKDIDTFKMDLAVKF
jgi:hypothetical protein